MIEQNYRTDKMLNEEDLKQIHESSMDILENTGVEVPNEKIRDLFKENGAEVDGDRVCIPETLVEESIEKAPSEFTIYARNSDKNVDVGKDHAVLAPGYGPPYATDIDEGRREGTFEDYKNFAKLASWSDHIDVVGGIMVEPKDIPEKIRPQKMVLGAAEHSDQPVFGTPLNKEKAFDCIKLASMLHGKDLIDDKSVLITLVNTTSPLGWDKNALDALMEHAKYNQAVVIASLIMSGLTGPMTIAGTLTLQNVEVLSGIVLTQLINPGTPAVYGSASTIADMKKGNLTVGAPEYAKFIGATAQIADYYDLPSRAGGTITDSLLGDAQAGYESMMSSISSVYSGIDFVLHSIGLLENYMAMSYEKFMIDNEILGFIKNYQEGIEVNEDTIAKEVISDIGPGDNYMRHSHTMEHMQDFRKPELSIRESYEPDKEVPSTVERANEKWKKVLSEYDSPKLEEGIKEKMEDYINDI
ncbi:MAG: Trimethylamine:corrinoid methyltransferase, MttB2 [Candidatus Methanohalarchaeum thermophilum]|uniref:Trimethylamine methyltransferase n=1 Tax=Methanohalarchaeum thermophilum TaxID=1903181 RepID=A0A1Q6DVN7_METT1|nr:MAG: Trimethylamine:corrinoid methyltransferase, MttB2 [Candidatus Methanohalarchaeum thermophilum]